MQPFAVDDGREPVLPRPVSRVLRPQDKRMLDERVQRASDLAEVITDEPRQLLARDETVRVPTEEQEKVQIARVFQVGSVKKPFNLVAFHSPHHLLEDMWTLPPTTGGRNDGASPRSLSLNRASASSLLLADAAEPRRAVQAIAAAPRLPES